MQALLTSPNGCPSQGDRPPMSLQLAIILSRAIIVRIEASGNYATVYTLQGKQYLLSKSLGTLSRQLPQFWRVHKSHLVNPDYIIGSIQSVRRKSVLRLTTGVTVPVARRMKGTVCSKLIAIL